MAGLKRALFFDLKQVFKILRIFLMIISTIGVTSIWIVRSKTYSFISFEEHLFSFFDFLW